MGIFSIVSNYFLVYPVYYNFMPEEVILAAYQAILPSVKNILQCLICFNMPFTLSLIHIFTWIFAAVDVAGYDVYHIDSGGIQRTSGQRIDTAGIAGRIL